MGLVADILLMAAALGATFYCFILSRRLRRFNDLEKGVGGAISTLSVQVTDMTKTLEKAQGAATNSADSLGDLTTRAEDVAGRLELLVAAMHDIPAASKQSDQVRPGSNAPPANPEGGGRETLPGFTSQRSPLKAAE